MDNIKHRCVNGGIVLCLFWLSACASTTVRSVSRAPAFDSAQIRRVMVVGLFKDPDLRKTFEDEFVRQWRTHGVEAVSSLEVLPPTATLDKAGVRPIALAGGFDMVLVSRVTERKTIPPGQVGTFVIEPQSQSESENINTALQVLFAPPVSTNAYELAALETNLYDVAAGRRVWSAASETKISGKMAQRVEPLIRRLLNRLYRPSK